jgi:hypothetical protein
MKTKQFEDYTDEEIRSFVEMGILVLPGLKHGPLTTSSYLTVEIYENIIILKGHFSGDIGGAIEIFTTREKVNRFIDKLTQARDKVFPE